MIEISRCTYLSIKDAIPVQWRHNICTNDHLYFSASIDQQELLGLLIAERSKERNCCIKLLYVIPEFRRRGIATKLLTDFFLEARSNSCTISVITEIPYRGIILFLLKKKFQISQIECKGIVIMKEHWVTYILPHLQLYTANQLFMRKPSVLLSKYEKMRIEDVLKNMNIPDYLRPFNRSTNEISFFYTTEQNEPIGWIVMSFPSDLTIELKCTFILPKYRNSRFVFMIWNDVTMLVISNKPNINRLIFYYDPNEFKLELFYRRLLKDCPYRNIEKIKMIHEIPFF